ncbi:hypothetical protein Tco_0992659 [Tanacetum coccineum]|uniref:Uncharacterized protein n=1 Tax=Tanacetum coccineum TaxID=301880 RepID=A0ABQ5F336_9ASTR
MKLTDERPAQTDIRLSLASHSYIYPLGIAEDIFVEVAEHVYLFDKGIITLRSGKSKISFNRIPESLCKDEKGTKNDIEPIASTMSVNRLVLEYKEKIKIHQEKKMEFDRWRNKNLKNERHAPVKIKDGMDDEGDVVIFDVMKLGSS